MTQSMEFENIFLTLPSPKTPTGSIDTAANSPMSETSENSMETTTTQSVKLQDPEGENSSESELTSLAWLTEIKNIGNISLTETPSNNNPTIRFNKFMTEIKRSREAFEKKSHAFRTNPHEKPPFNYAHIIGMAMMDKDMMTLKDICNWIKENFAYYKYVGNWNNSIRHNLSLSVFFTKVARNKNEKGKGGYWKLAMDYTKTEKKRVRRSKNHNRSTTSSPNSNNSSHNLRNNKMPKRAADNCEMYQEIQGLAVSSSTSTSTPITDCGLSTNHQALDMLTGGGVGGMENDSSHFITIEGLNLDATIDHQQHQQQLQQHGAITSCIEINGEFLYNLDVCLNDGDNSLRADNFYETVAATEIISELNNVDHEIFLESDIPQPIDEIALPFVFNLPQSGPNVITEAIPHFTNLPGLLDSIDNSDFSAIKFNEYDELEKFLNLNQDFM